MRPRRTGPHHRDEVLEIFNDFTRSDNHSILISSHILSDLEKLCDYIAFLHQGQLLFCDEKDALLDGYGIFIGTAEQADSLAPDAPWWPGNPRDTAACGAWCGAAPCPPR